MSLEIGDEMRRLILLEFYLLTLDINAPWRISKAD